MNTVFISESILVFLGTEERTSAKSGNKFTMITFGDAENYTNHSFFKRDEVNLMGLQQGDKVKIRLGLESRGYTQNLNLLSVEKIAK